VNTMVENSMKTAEEAAHAVTENAGKTARRTRYALIDGLHAAASVVTMLRGLGLGDALGWVGLERRRTKALPIALGVGAGLLAGVAAGILLAPRAGAETRRRLASRATNALGEAEGAVAQVMDQARDKMSDLVGAGSNGGQPNEPTKPRASAGGHPPGGQR
jgi:YtxH-like protein